MKLNLSEASNLVNAIEDAAAIGKVNDVVMPNGKQFGTCSKEYLYEVVYALEDAIVEFGDQLAANDEHETLQ
jgi:hypothetical protein